MNRERVPHESRTVARHGRLPRGTAVGHLARLILASLAVLIVSAASVAAVAVYQIRSNITTVALPEQEGVEAPAPPGLGGFEGGFNMLVVGSDECVDNGGCPDRTEKLADFTMLLHVADDHQSAVAVSFPRDMIVPIPSCPKADGSGTYSAMAAQQFNASFSYGGLPCTVLTVRELTGLSIPYAGVMTFAGVEQISTAIGGVPVCIDAPINDKRSGLVLDTVGEHVLSGTQALQFLRTRYGVGDGSDTGRIGSQQAFLSSMLRTIRSNGTLSNPSQIFSLASAASRNMVLSDNLSDLTLASMAVIFKDIPLNAVTFAKYPAGARNDAPNRVFPISSSATELFDRIEADLPVAPDQTAPGVGTVIPPTATPASPSQAAISPSASPTGAVPSPTSTTDQPIPGVTGQTADQQACTKANN